MKRSRSGSLQSASSSSSSSSDDEVAKASASTSRLPETRNLSGISYKPPRGFDAITFSPKSILTEKKLSSNKDKEVWVLRVPAGISPSHLNGLVLQLPSQGPDTHDLSTPLATLQTSTASSTNTYNMYVSKPELKSKGKSEAVSNTESQLISMAAEGSLNPSNPKESKGLNGNAESAIGQGAAAELRSLKLLVPADDGSKAGKLVFAPVKISKCLHLSVASPAISGIASTKPAATEASEVKTKRQQPWELLTGSFKPAGTRNVNGESPKRKAESSQGIETSPKKASRKAKKD